MCLSGCVRVRVVWCVWMGTGRGGVCGLYLGEDMGMWVGVGMGMGMGTGMDVEMVMEVGTGMGVEVDKGESPMKGS